MTLAPCARSAAARSHTVFVDRPLENGGSDRGPLGGEYLLIALGGCFLSTLLAAARTREADVSNVRVSVVGTIAGVPERFESMAVRVPRSAGYAAGAAVKLSWNPSAAHYFDATTGLRTN